MNKGEQQAPVVNNKVDSPVLPHKRDAFPAVEYKLALIIVKKLAITNLGAANLVKIHLH